MISGHAFMYLTRRVRSMMESFFVKSQVFPTNRILLTTVHILTWKIPTVLVELFFHKSLGWLLLKVLQQIRPCSKSATKKGVELFQLMIIGCLYKYLVTYFWSLWRGQLLVKLQASPLNSTGSRFLQVYCRAQNTR